ncbi:hypothetical protein KBI52_19480, partial [Microvirga sp. HBU67558]|uniref:hypothetical protein n=1 Tax=Microvirga sp. HBU67558 TaxID=2824562 RepID=UPI001B394243
SRAATRATLDHPDRLAAQAAGLQVLLFDITIAAAVLRSSHVMAGLVPAIPIRKARRATEAGSPGQAR